MLASPLAAAYGVGAGPGIKQLSKHLRITVLRLAICNFETQAPAPGLLYKNDP